jgi:hypothetical protein
MPLPEQPFKAIFPIVIVRYKASIPRYRFLGTGFFIDNDGTFITAKHLFTDEVSTEEHTYNAVTFNYQTSQLLPCPISDLKFSPQFDIALGRVEGAIDIQPLGIATDNYPMNFDIVTAEFSLTHPKRTERGEVGLYFESCFRKGYVIRHYTSTYPEPIPTWCLELSFPALKGASGAPVLVESGGSVIGMIVQNVGRELLPAQVETVTEPGKYTEEIKYYLPSGKAISWVHLTEFVNSVRKQPKQK